MQGDEQIILEVGFASFKLFGFSGVREACEAPKNPALVTDALPCWRSPCVALWPTAGTA